MNRSGKLLLGLIMIAAGAGGLVYVNVQLIPAALSQQPAPTASATTTPTEPPTTPPPPTAATTTPTPSVTTPPSASATASASAEAASSGPTAPIKFEITQVTLKNLSKTVEPLATWLKKNPNEKILLVGHGDPKTRLRDYMEVGRARSLTIRRALLDWGVQAARVQVQPPEMEGDQVKGGAQLASMVEIRVLPKGER